MIPIFLENFFQQSRNPSLIADEEPVSSNESFAQKDF